MVLKAYVEANKSSASSVAAAKTPTVSKTSTKSDLGPPAKRKSSLGKKDKRIRSKTVEGTDLKVRTNKTPPPKRQISADNALNSWLVGLKNENSETEHDKTSTKAGEEVEEDEGEQEKNNSSTNVGKQKLSNSELRKGKSECHKRALVYEKPSQTFMKLYKEGNAGKHPKPKLELTGKKPSEIPKLKQLSKLNGKHQKTTTETMTASSKVTAESKTQEQNPIDEKQQGKTLKKDVKTEDKIKHAMKENFSSLVPLYEKELKRIADTWVSTIYCSLTMRHNLVKLLYQAMPNINRSQFHMENETILHCLSHAKSHTRSEVDNLIQFIKLLISNRNKVRDDYTVMIANKVIAETYDNNWRGLSKKIQDLGEEIKQLQADVPDLMKKKETYEAMANEKIQKIQSNINHKEEEIKKLDNQLTLLKQREHSYKGNVSLKIEDYKDIKEEVTMLKTMEKQFEELKVDYHNQNEIYEKKIKDLEGVLEERRRTLNKEKDVKKQLQSFLIQLRSHQQHLYRTIGKEQVDFVMGRFQGRNKRKEQLWMSAIKLVLKGFLVQTRKLERDKNKMLLELNSNSLENYSALATAIMEKDQFVRSIRQQMNAFNMAGKYLTTKTSESSVADYVKN